jgi:hypothetical protein
MRFSIRQLSNRQEAFANYAYEIFDGPCLVATYWHDYRGDEHGIVFVDGRSEEWPVGRVTDFLTGGGPRPLGLSNAAVAYLAKKLS